MNKFYCYIALIFFAAQVVAQSNEPLFTYDNIPVDLEEFKYVYEKNNVNENELYSDASVREYLDLYVKFKLKVREAELLGLDQTDAFKSEYGRYKKQLSKSYLIDRQVTEEMIKQAYDRVKEERKVAHILLMCNDKTPPDDTLKLFSDITDIYKEIKSGVKPFEKAAKLYSEDTMVNLGYFTAFQTVYPFENGMYETPVGSVSKPVRTKYGYHLINVLDKREAKGKVEVAYILKKIPKRSNDEMKKIIEKEIYGIYDSLKRGAKFEDMAKRNSDDKSTAFNGGKWKWLNTGEALERFEKVAFSLDIGEFAEPILTSNGWYIIKSLNKKVIGPYEDMKSEIQDKILKDSRSETVRKTYIRKLKQEYNYQANENGFVEFMDRMDVASLNRGNWKSPKEEETNDLLFTIGGKDFFQKDFAKFIEQNQNARGVKGRKTIIEKLTWLRGAFQNKALLKMEEEKLETTNMEFKRLLKEYRDGIILFELMNEKVWRKATSDTTGLFEYFENNKQNYLTDPKLKGKIFTVKNEQIAKSMVGPLLKMEKKRKKGKTKKSLDEILQKMGLNKDDGKVSYVDVVHEKEENEITDAIEWTEGISRTFNNEDGSITFVLVEDIIKPVPKKLSECRGFVISDYNDELENKWVQELKQKYPVEINYKKLDELIKTK